MAKLTPQANRAARAILQWSVRDLAKKANVAFSTVHRFEKTGTCSATVEEKIIQALRKERVEITNGLGTGARLLSVVDDDNSEVIDNESD